MADGDLVKSFREFRSKVDSDPEYYVLPMKTQAEYAEMHRIGRDVLKIISKETDSSELLAVGAITDDPVCRQQVVDIMAHEHRVYLETRHRRDETASTETIVADATTFRNADHQLEHREVDYHRVGRALASRRVKRM
jgi:hypothetical protein